MLCQTIAAPGWNEGATWSHTYNPDRYGNTTIAGHPAPSLGCTAYSTATNRWLDAALDYDAAGNLTTYAGWQIDDDTGDRQRSLTSGGTTFNYHYDGEGRRVKKGGRGASPPFTSTMRSANWPRNTPTPARPRRRPARPAS